MRDFLIGRIPRKIIILKNFCMMLSHNLRIIHQCAKRSRMISQAKRWKTIMASTPAAIDQSIIPNESTISTWVEILKNRSKGDIIVTRSIGDMKALRKAMDVCVSQSNSRPARVGFVPTMGALHAGHIKLIDVAKKGGVDGPADFTVSSIFVNPTQFAPHEDLSTYPRTWNQDLAALCEVGCDVVFAPTALDMYPVGSPFRTFVDVAGVDYNTPEGVSRPGFFRGVGTVVMKLLNSVGPTRSIFGQKDGIQCIVVRTMARDMNLSTFIDVVETLREHDGLAMSSRNVYLTSDERAVAHLLYKALSYIRNKFQASTEGQERLKSAATLRLHRKFAQVDSSTAEKIAQNAANSYKQQNIALDFSLKGESKIDPYITTLIHEGLEIIIREGRGLFGEIQYFTLSDALTGAPIERIEDSKACNGAVMLSIAIKIGKTRLLDNIMLVGEPSDLGKPDQ
jgi:pantoate--beta-alanine ligase